MKIAKTVATLAMALIVAFTTVFMVDASRPIRSGFTRLANAVRRSSGTVITPTFGSIVQKGKLAACAFALLRQLNNVDFPTLGNPTIPHLRAISGF
jgi:hypothetical protein